MPSPRDYHRSGLPVPLIERLPICLVAAASYVLLRNQLFTKPIITATLLSVRLNNEFGQLNLSYLKIVSLPPCFCPEQTIYSTNSCPNTDASWEFGTPIDGSAWDQYKVSLLVRSWLMTGEVSVDQNGSQNKKKSNNE